MQYSPLKFFLLSYRRHTSGGGGIYNVNVAETQSRQSRDSPIGGGSYSIVDEKVDNSTSNADGMTPVTKHTHRKSVFKKRGTSSPSMVSVKIKNHMKITLVLNHYYAILIV